VAADKELHRCVACGINSAVSHCADDHPTCTWMTCRNKPCDAVWDTVARRGHRIDPDSTKEPRPRKRFRIRQGGRP